MKKIFGFCAAVVLFSSLVACGDDDTNTPKKAYCKAVVTCDITKQEVNCSDTCTAMKTCTPACKTDGTEYCDPCTGACAAIPEQKTCTPACTSPQVCNASTGTCVDSPVCTPACAATEVCTF